MKNAKIFLASLIYCVAAEAGSVISSIIALYNNGGNLQMGQSFIDYLSLLNTGSDTNYVSVLFQIAYAVLILAPLTIGLSRYIADVLRGEKAVGLFSFYKTPSMYLGCAKIVLATNIVTYIANFLPTGGILKLILQICGIIYSLFIFFAEFYYALNPDEGAAAAVERSFALSDGHKAGIFGMTLLVGLIQCIYFISLFVPVIAAAIISLPLSALVIFASNRLLVPYACGIINGDTEEQEYEGEPVTEPLSDDEIYVEDKSFGGIISEEFEYPEDIDIIPLIEKMDISYSVIADYDVRKKFRQLYKKACEEVVDFESYEGGRICTLEDECECSDHYLTLRLTLQRDSDSAPYKLTLETEEQHDMA